MGKPKCIILDLEGTITNCQHRLAYLKKKDYESWNLLFPEDDLNDKILQKILKARSEKTRVIINTAKSADYSEEVLGWLSKKQILEHIHSILFRLSNQEDWPSVRVKEYQLSELKMYNDIEYVIDDRIENCKMYVANGLTTYHYENDNLHLIGLNHPGPAPTPDKRLEEAAELFRSRNTVYGSSYMEFGKIMKAFFPNGINLESEKDFSMFAILTISISKMDRYCKNFSKGGHPDSMDDLSVYAQMINHIAEVIK